MLLSSLSILMGAIMVPSDYLWVYSTYIIMVCLYLIWSKRLFVLFLTFLSFICVTFSEYSDFSLTGLKKGEFVWVDFQEKTVFYPHLDAASSVPPFISPHVRVVLFSPDGERFRYSTVRLEFSSEPPSISNAKSHLYHAELTSILHQSKTGSWWQKQLYASRHQAELTLKLINPDANFWAEMRVLTSSDETVRSRLLLTLESALSDHDSWRFSKALLWGEDDLWSERDTWVIRTLGLAHLFVVSGLHTGFMFVIGRIVSRAVWWALPQRWVLSGVTRWQCDAVVIIPLLLVYAYLTQWGEPVVRAGIMLSVYLLARAMALRVLPHHIITFALWLVLLVDPRTIMQPGLWLSFSMVYLLIGYCQTSTRLSRLFMVQVMLSTASMVLILGWQEAISSLSIFVNILLIPFAAFVWFPFGLLSCMEVMLLSSDYVYTCLDWLLSYVLQGLEWIAFEWLLLFYDVFYSTLPRWLLLFLVLFWVYQSPLKRGMLSAVFIWWVVFSSALFQGRQADYQLTNRGNQLLLMQGQNTLINNAWVEEDFSRLMLSQYMPAVISKESVKATEGKGLMMSSYPFDALSPKWLLLNNVTWLVLRREESPEVMAMLEALDVQWVIIPESETLSFYLYNGQISLRHSSCLYAFFLFKSDTCKRVEMLESVLN
ncbi:ComEC/Rec2 family competence protein [Marinomonas algarum]|uniref:ComEC/Rec2 family competence protein n=1 Tax=Marinomonas algarum TaxID=2883105 RepID=A0A9X1IMB6_9GAMM|nr:ComEC/Rec2 family competence protein [Marinomonas algarum]MCB5161865.1 ComEC/Rec2 family competence protein [Marinomonas algarum]